jgi:3-(methylthio)propanoyl-CoA dehydrogenase
MGNFFKDNPDIHYYFEKGLDWEPLVAVSEYGYRTKDGFTNKDDAVQFYTQVAETIGEFAADEIAPYAKAFDREEAHLKDGEVVCSKRLDQIFEGIKGLGLPGMCLPRELGGMNVPLTVYFMTAELLARADTATMNHYSFHGGIAMAMLAFSSHEGTTTFDKETWQIQKTRFEPFAREIGTGAAWGCMDITEPNAGSDMARLRAVGEQDEQGNWFVSGQKIFITSGHGKYHFVIARTEKVQNPNDPYSGLNGLSMFLVPAYEEDADGNRRRIVTIDRVEEKLGHHAGVTTTLNFDRAPAHLVGKRGEGFKYMLVLMNNARLGVGFEAIGLCEAAYRMAKEYAEGRTSMGKTIDRHEMLADYLDEMRSDIEGLRALAVHAAAEEELAQKTELAVRWGLEIADHPQLDATVMKRNLRKHKAVARRLTPLLKYLAGEKAVEIARRALQIHGGNGFTKEYEVERLLRDSIVIPIYEGTSQIQSLMVMKDSLTGIMKNPQAFARRMAQARWRKVSARDPLERRVAEIQVHAASALSYLLARTAGAKLKSLKGKPVGSWRTEFTKNWDPKRDFALAMLHAERLTRLLADEAICEVLLAQAQKHPERRDVLERYLDRAELRAKHLHELITTTGHRLLGTLAANGDGAPRAAMAAE